MMGSNDDGGKGFSSRSGPQGTSSLTFYRINLWNCPQQANLSNGNEKFKEKKNQPHSSMVRSCARGYCSDALLVPVKVSFRFSGSRASRCERMCECVCTVPCDGLTFHPGCIPIPTQCSLDRLQNQCVTSTRIKCLLAMNEWGGGGGSNPAVT